MVNNITKVTNENKELLNNNKSVVNTNPATANPLIEKFKEFVHSYNNIDKIDSKVLEIVNTAFKTQDKFSKDIQSEANLRVDTDEFEKFCISNINDKSQITITLNDPNLTEFIKIYKDLKTSYLENCEYLLNLLETKILIKEKVNASDETPRFTVQNIGYSDLVSLETDVRNRLINMYAKCHQHYQEGIKALFNALKEKANETQ